MEINDLKLTDKIDGIWCPYYDDQETRFFIASTESTAYKKCVARLSRKISPSKLRKSPELQQQLTAAAMAESILLDFEGVKENGKALKNTLENRKKLLAIPDLRDFISDQAMDLANFQAGGEAEDAASLKSSA